LKKKPLQQELYNTDTHLSIRQVIFKSTADYR